MRRGWMNAVLLLSGLGVGFACAEATGKDSSSPPEQVTPSSNLSDGAIFVSGLNVGSFSGSSSSEGTWHGDYLTNRVPGPWNPIFRCIATASCGSMATESVEIRLCYADLNCDTLVDDSDFVLFVSAYNALLCEDASVPAPCAPDLNGDGLVDDADFVIFVAAYNELLCP